MNDFQDIYGIQEDQDAPADVLRYYFISKGKTDIVKTIDYQYVGHFNGIPLFNLAFGDYNPETDLISDEEVSNNHDHYKVLHTVLNTIPLLFDTYGDVILMVQGSDSSSEFINKCRNDCKRRCAKGVCKKAHRRINIYTGFINKNFTQLNRSYRFYGGKWDGNQEFIEPYSIDSRYKTVLVVRKKS